MCSTLQHKAFESHEVKLLKHMKIMYNTMSKCHTYRWPFVQTYTHFFLRGDLLVWWSELWSFIGVTRLLSLDSDVFFFGVTWNGSWLACCRLVPGNKSLLSYYFLKVTCQAIWYLVIYTSSEHTIRISFYSIQLMSTDYH